LKVRFENWKYLGDNIFLKKCEKALQADFDLLTGRTEKCSNVRDQCFGNQRIFFWRRSQLSTVFLNATEGPVFLGKSEVWEGNLFAVDSQLCEKAVVRGMPKNLWNNDSWGPL